MVATITAYDAYEGFTLTIDGNVYYLMNGDYSGGVSLAFMSEDYSIIGSGFIKDSTGEEPGGKIQNHQSLYQQSISEHLVAN